MRTCLSPPTELSWLGKCSITGNWLLFSGLGEGAGSQREGGVPLRASSALLGSSFRAGGGGAGPALGSAVQRMSGVFQTVPLDGCGHRCSFALGELRTPRLAGQPGDLCDFNGVGSREGFQAINAPFSLSLYERPTKCCRQWG